MKKAIIFCTMMVATFLVGITSCNPNQAEVLESTDTIVNGTEMVPDDDTVFCGGHAQGGSTSHKALITEF